MKNFEVLLMPLREEIALLSAISGLAQVLELIATGEFEAKIRISPIALAIQSRTRKPSTTTSILGFINYSHMILVTKPST